MNPDSLLYENPDVKNSLFQISLMSSVEFGMQTPGVEFSAGSIKKELNVSELNATFTIIFNFSSCITNRFKSSAESCLKNFNSFILLCRGTVPLKVNDTVPVFCELRTVRYR
jgi:hypothetical protein